MRVNAKLYAEYVNLDRAEKPKTHVFNRHRGAPKDAVYIGRGSPFGNPFVIGRDGDRDAVCDKFEHYVDKKPELIALVRRVLRGKNLVCFCAPQRCHGETLMRIANS